MTYGRLWQTDAAGGWIVSFSDTLSLGGKRCFTKFAGLPHKMRLPANYVLAFSNGLKLTLSTRHRLLRKRLQMSLAAPDVAGSSGEGVDFSV